MITFQSISRVTLLISSAAPLAAQQTLYELGGFIPGSWTDWELVSGGDFNGDSIQDIVITGNGVYSGVDGGPLFAFGTSLFPGHAIWLSASFLSDLDGDGRDDLLVQGRYPVSPNLSYGRLYVYGTATSSVLYSIDGDANRPNVGSAMSSIGDANGDSYDDFAVAWPFWENSQGVETGLIQVFSGPTGALLYEIEGSSSGETPFGWNIGPAGDLNNDGLADLAVFHNFAYASYGELFVYSSANQAELLHLVGTQVQERVGSSVQPVEDLNQDGFPELLVGTGYSSFSGSSLVDPRVLVISGQTGEVLRELRGDLNDAGFPSSITTVQDLNEDGVREILVSSVSFSGSNGGRIYMFSGLDGNRLSTTQGDGIQNYFGHQISSIGDVTGDGLDEVAVSARTLTEVFVRVLGNVFPGEGQHFCFASPNSTGAPVRLQARLGSPGINYHLDALDGPRGEYGYFLVGSHADIVAPGMPIQGGLCLGVRGGAQIGRYNQTGNSRNSVGQFDADGVFQNVAGTSASGPGFDIPVELPFPGNPGITAGSTWHFQLLYRDNLASGALTNWSSGLSLTF